MGGSRLIVSESEVTFIVRCTRKLGFMIWAPRKLCRSGHGEVSTANKGTDGAGLVGGDIFPATPKKCPGTRGSMNVRLPSLAGHFRSADLRVHQDGLFRECQAPHTLWSAEALRKLMPIWEATSWHLDQDIPSSSGSICHWALENGNILPLTAKSHFLKSGLPLKA